MSRDDELTYAMDRGAIWKSALRLLKDANVDYTPGDVTELAEFLAGDNIPFTPMETAAEREDDNDRDSESPS